MSFPHPAHPTRCIARRDQGLLWVIVHHQTPRSTPLPLSRDLVNHSPVVSRQGLPPREDPARHICWWNPEAPWEPLTPVLEEKHAGSCPWIFGYTSSENDIQGQPFETWARMSKESYKEAWATRGVVGEMLSGVLGLAKAPKNRPALPEPPVPDWYHDEEAARCAIWTLRRALLDCVAYTLYVMTLEAEEGRSVKFETGEARAFVTFLMLRTKRRGVAFDPFEISDEGWTEFERWMRLEMPVAYVWSLEHQQYTQHPGLDPKSASSLVEIDDVASQQDRRYAVVNRRGDSIGYDVPAAQRFYFETQYLYEDFYHAFLHIDHRLYYRSEPIPDDAIEGGSPDLDFADENDLVRPCILEEVVYLHDVIEHLKEGAAIEDVLREKRDRSARLRRGRPHLEDRLSTPSKLRERRELEGTDEEAHVDAAREAKEAQLTWDFEQIATERQWFNIGRTDPDILAGRIVRNLDSFMRCATIEFPPATEARSLHYLLTHPGADQGDLLTMYVRTGQPFRLYFTEAYNQWYTKRFHEVLLDEAAGLTGSTRWQAGEKETTLSPVSAAGPYGYRMAYLDGVSRIAHYPHFPRLLMYGGLIWRLAVAFRDEDILRILEGPSVAWSLYGIGAPKNPSRALCSETYNNPRDDDLVKVLLGMFDDDKTMWPLPEMFMKSWRWKGEWTGQNEEWFKKRWATIHDGVASPKSRREWREEFGRAPKSVRLAGYDRDINEQVVASIADMRDSGIFDDSFMYSPGRVEGDNPYIFIQDRFAADFGL